MINIIACLVLISCIGLIKQRMKYDRLMSWIMLFVGVLLFIDFAMEAVNFKEGGFSFLWSTSKIGDITIDFKPSPMECRLILPLFFISLMTILYNNIYRYEEKKSAFNSYILLNLVSLSLLICSKNYVQLTTAIFTIDILGYLLLKDVDSSHRYVVYNFFADMCLYMVLTLVSGRLESLAISDIPQYLKIGHHKDFVGLILLFVVLIKAGSFMFHSYIVDLNSAKFQRMSAVNMLYAPLAGVLMALKLHGLLIVSDFVYPILKVVSFLTILYGIGNAICTDNIKKKLIYLNMSFIGLLLIMLANSDFHWDWSYSFYYGVAYFINLLFLKIYLYQNNENKVSLMLNSKETNSLMLKATLLQFILIFNIFITLIFEISAEENKELVFVYGLAILFSIAVILNHIYSSPHSRRLEKLSPNSLRPISFLATVSILLYANAEIGAYSMYNWMFIIILLLIIKAPFITSLRKIYEIEWLQKEDISKSFFLYTLVTPFMYISRTLWLMVDFIFSEKIITTSLNGMHKIGISLFFKINQKNYITYFLFIIAGILCFIASYYRRQM